MTKILSWNVNSLRIRLAELERIAREENPDVVCLQEVKAKKEDFPFAEIEALGYPHIALYSMPKKKTFRLPPSKRPVLNISPFTAWPATTAWPFFPAVR